MIIHKDLPAVDNKYWVLRFNFQIGKYLHVEEFSCPDLSYMVNILSSYNVCTHLPVFVVLKCCAQYLNYNMYCSIMYHSGSDLDDMNLLWYAYVNGQFYEHIIHNEV